MMEYEILAIRYAYNAERHGSENFLGGDSHDGSMPMDFFVWVLKGGGRTIVIDTGFDANMTARRSRKLTRPVADGLKAAGVDLAEVKDVILTHMHYNHASNHDVFPNARYHVQDREMEYCTGRCMCHATLRHQFEADDVTAMVRKLFQGRVKFHNGASEIADGVSVHLVCGHSRGLQLARVRTGADGSWLPPTLRITTPISRNTGRSRWSMTSERRSKAMMRCGDLRLRSRISCRVMIPKCCSAIRHSQAVRRILSASTPSRRNKDWRSSWHTSDSVRCSCGVARRRR